MERVGGSIVEIRLPSVTRGPSGSVPVQFHSLPFPTLTSSHTKPMLFHTFVLSSHPGTPPPAPPPRPVHTCTAHRPHCVRAPQSCCKEGRAPGSYTPIYILVSLPCSCLIWMIRQLDLSPLAVSFLTYK